MYILTYATHNERYFPYLEKNKEITILGMGEKWNGFRDKVNAVIKFTESCNENDLILFVDGFDLHLIINFPSFLSHDSIFCIFGI